MVSAAQPTSATLRATAAPTSQAERPANIDNQMEQVPMLRADAIRYEHGEGVAKDQPFAAQLYCRAARLGDAQSQFNLGWMLAYGRGIERSDAQAAYFFEAAAAQGIAQAVTMLQRVGGPTSEVPPCVRELERREVDKLRAERVAAETAAADARLALETEAARARAERLVASAPKTIVALVRRMAPEFRVEPQLALAIMKAESNFDSRAVSPKNAQGLMQLIPETAARFGVRNAFDEKQNIRGGLAYLRWLLAYFEGDVALVAAAYNAGEGTVDKYLGVPPYLETRAYVQRIVGVVGEVVHPFDARITGPSPQLGQIREPLRDSRRTP